MLTRGQLNILGTMSSTTSLLIAIITLIARPTITITQTSVAGLAYSKEVSMVLPLLLFALALLVFGVYFLLNSRK